jgi:serine/threonine-protein kinase HipA
MNRSAKVYVNDDLAGILVETTEGEFQFQYENLYLSGTSKLPVSLTLPKRKEAYHSKVLFSFFDGLIPEGWLLDIAIKSWKINPRDRMGLLLHLCQDCIGNVHIIENNDE